MQTVKVMQYQLPVFENLCPSWAQASHLGIRRVFTRGSRIFDVEAPVNGIYVVREGTVEVILYTAQGPEKVLYHLGPACIFGEVSCFVTGESDEARARARSDCTLDFFSREVIEGPIARQYPHLLIELVRASAYKIRMFSVLLQDSLDNDNFMRVCKMLVYLVQFKGGKIEKNTRQVIFNPAMTQNDMARLMGVHRVTVTKAIGRLKNMGIVGGFTKTELSILNYPGLCDLVNK
ncbi:MAG: Crp/Fnr family transcriptional regulator [Anaerolineae bacterium]|nr:Crp/Fnr family transcriptional regulator [Anaerolineae bacterium]